MLDLSCEGCKMNSPPALSISAAGAEVHAPGEDLGVLACLAGPCTVLVIVNSC